MPSLLCYRTSICLAAAFVLTIGCAPGCSQTKETAGSSYEDLAALFEEWRAFERPEFVDGVPDYTAPAMARQHRRLAGYQRRLGAIDSTGWPISRRVD